MCRYWFIALLVLISSIAFSQGKEIKILHADNLSFDNNRHILRGAVKCEHEGAILQCDTAIIYRDQNNMVAYGHVLITKGDSIRLTGDLVLYDGKTRIASLEKNVKCTDRDMVLTTKTLLFDLKTNIASYYNGGTLVNKSNTLVSKNGHYYSNTREATFHYDVVLTNPQYEMKSDTLRYRLNNRTAYFIGPSIIVSKKDYIYCENGWYDTQNEKSAFSKNALLVTENQKLRGDSLVYDRKSQVGRAYRNVTLFDTSGISFLQGNYIEYKQKGSIALATGRPLYCRIMNNDSLFLAADTMYHRDVDSTWRFLNAYHHVRIFKSDMQAMADSATLSTKDSLLSLFKSPVLWMKNSQATSKEIKVNLTKQEIKGFRLEGKAFLVQLPDTNSKHQFNQMTGKEIIGQLTNDTIRKININGNSEIIYFPKNKDKSIGLNHTTSTDMVIWFKNGNVARVSLRPLTKGKIDPISKIDSKGSQLKGFTWLYESRPKSRFDLFN